MRFGSSLGLTFLKDPLFDVAECQYFDRSFPSPSAVHSARQYGEAGRCSSSAPMTWYVAVLSCR